jgi:hypothetical protein
VDRHHPRRRHLDPAGVLASARRGPQGPHSFVGFFLLSLLFFPLALILAYVADDRTARVA